MRALLLAAGVGSRLLPITATTPKCMVMIDGRPLLDYWLGLLFGAGIERVLINTHWLAGQVNAYVQASRWAPRIDLVHEERSAQELAESLLDEQEADRAREPP